MEQRTFFKDGYPKIAGERISLEQAKERTSLFRDKYIHQKSDKEEVVKANLFSKENILEVLNQPGCCGIRIYHSVNPQGINPVSGKREYLRELILVGTDDNGNDLLTSADYKGPGQAKKGCNPLRAFSTTLASPQQAGAAVLIANPCPCPDLCSQPPNQLTGS